MSSPSCRSRSISGTSTRGGCWRVRSPRRFHSPISSAVPPGWDARIERACGRPGPLTVAEVADSGSASTSSRTRARCCGVIGAQRIADGPPPYGCSPGRGPPRPLRRSAFEMTSTAGRRSRVLGTGASTTHSGPPRPPLAPAVLPALSTGPRCSCACARVRPTPEVAVPARRPHRSAPDGFPARAHSLVGALHRMVLPVRRLGVLCGGRARRCRAGAGAAAPAAPERAAGPPREPGGLSPAASGPRSADQFASKSCVTRLTRSSVGQVGILVK